MKTVPLPFPEQVLASHIALLGKTGSGKTSTGKFIVEHVVDQDFRVCILDSTKSDWWGITSSASGKSPGLPFKILGGPRGHLPLHSNAGKALGQLVGSGKLPLSIIDMADFEAGGLQRFFVDFAPALLRSMRGVVYLVMEEAHEFAPKERAGFGAESMAIHWAKKLATAGRSKGIRLIVATQRVQALHNALLGSCETLMAHRVTTPADQKPIIDWLKSNASKDTAEQVASTISSLPTGTAWVCSGEAKVFEQIKFPKFATYDNTATPTGDGDLIDVKTAPVDQDELKAIIGDAVKEAIANDPKLLHATIRTLTEENRKLKAAPATVAWISEPNMRRVISRAVADRDIFWRQQLTLSRDSFRILKAMTDRLANDSATVNERAIIEPPTDDINITGPTATGKTPIETIRRMHAEKIITRPAADILHTGNSELSRLERALLIAYAQHPRGLTKQQVIIYAGYQPSGPVSTAFARFAAGGWTAPDRLGHSITHLGVKALGPFEPLPIGRELRERMLRDASTLESKLLAALFAKYPEPTSKAEIVSIAGYQPSGPASSAFAKFNRLGWIVSEGKGIRASGELFNEG